MAGLIRRSDIDEVRARINLADVVGDYVTLKSAGVGSMKGLCPFHDERSPSFHVRPQVGFYHCFGCGEGGDVFSFLQKMDHVSFAEAVERMASRIGFELHYEDGGQPSDYGNRARLIGANAAAAEFFVDQLATPEAEPARRFLGERGFDHAAAVRFGVGFAPKSFDALSKHLKGRGFTEAEILAAGLVGQGDRGIYDRFRGRLVWPIRDVTGQTLGFGARRLLDDDKGPKYLNTPDTVVYHKSQVLYGLDLARKDIARGKQVVVVEGYTDVMACHLAGVTTAVATCGTAFGVDHITMIRRVLGDVDNPDARGTGEVIFTFDPDEAGQKAASRAFSEEQRFAAQTFVAVAEEGLDPCDLRLKKGDDAVRRLVRTRKPMFEFMIRRTLANHDLDSVEGRVAGLRAAAPVVAAIRDQAMGVGYERSLAGWLGMDPLDVHRAVSAARSSVTNNARQGGRRPAERDAPSDWAPSDPDGALDGHPDSARRDEASITQLPTDPATRLERDALMALLQQPKLVGRGLLERAINVTFGNRTLAIVRDTIAVNLDAWDSPGWVATIAEQVPGPFSTLVKQLSVAPIPERAEQLEVYCQGVAAALIETDLQHRKAELLGALQRTDRTVHPDRYTNLQRELMDIESERRTLRNE